MFQSTRPRGARHRVGQDVIRFKFSFNPRAHAGRDEGDIGRFDIAVVSIHAPTRGATCPACCTAQAINVSIHAPTRGATFTTDAFSQVVSVSIHAPTRGATAIR